MTAERPLPRVALIGISGYGTVYRQLVLELQHRGVLRLVAAVVINPEQERVAVAELRGLGCEIFADYGEMLARQRGALDLCLIPTGIAWHTRMTIAALEAGAHVLVEKPLASSMAEVRAVAAASRRTGRFVAVGFQDYYEPAAAWLKAQLASGAIGRVHAIRFLGQWPRPRSYFTRNDWAGKRIVNGVPVHDSPLSNAFAHFVNLSLWFASPSTGDDDPATVESAELFRANAIESFDTAVVRVRNTEGVALWFGATHACAITREPEIVIHGERGHVVWRHENEVELHVDGAPPVRRPMGDTFDARHDMISAVLRRLREPDTPICGPDVAGRHTALIEQIAAVGVITTVPSSMITWRPADPPTASVPVVTGLEDALLKAYASAGTLASVGFSIPPVLAEADAPGRQRA